MKRGLLQLPKVSLPWLETLLGDLELTPLREKMKAAQTEPTARVTIEVTSEELETLLDRFPESAAKENNEVTQLRQLILTAYQTL